MGIQRVRYQRSLTQVVVFIVLVLFAMACGGNASEESADTASGDAGEATVEKVAILLPGKKDDPGFSGTGGAALERVAADVGFEAAYAESVPVEDQVEVYRDFANQGFDVVIGWGGQFEDGAAEVADQFPDTYFAVVAGAGSNGSNYAAVVLAGEEWEFLQGYVAGKLTKTNKVAVISGPCFDASARQAYGFVDGAKHANPDVEATIVGLDSFDDPLAAKQAAEALISREFDNFYLDLNTGVQGVVEAAEDALKEGFQTYSYLIFVDQHELSPKTILTAGVRDLGVTIDETIKRINDGSWDGDVIEIPLKKDDQALAPFHGLAPESLYQEAKDVQAEIVSGEIEVPYDATCPFKTDL